jgi:cytochrome c oxidase subunit 1
MLIMVIPWSLGLIDGIDPLLARTLFWWFGHPLVYFWLLPAYIAWYSMMPALTNGKMFSEDLARLVFWLFLLLSTPVGFHHQYTDPGIPQAWKYLHMLLTMGVAFPSLLTAFSVCASLEIGGRANGGKGYLSWIRKLAWHDPVYASMNLAAILFVFGGIGGMINASYNINLVIHNTSWVPGHFHLTVGSATTLSFFGISYWLVPKLRGKRLFSRRMGLAQAWTWFFGMLIFGNAYHSLGLYQGAPRRTMLGAAPYATPEWTPLLMYSMIGITLLFISSTLYFLNILGTLTISRQEEDLGELPMAEPLHPKPAPKWLDTWWPWVNGAIALLILSYGPMLYQLFRDSEWLWPGLRVW